MDLDALMVGVRLTTDPETIRQWSKEVLRDGLYRPDGLAQYAFRGLADRYAMAYIPGIAWVLYHGSQISDSIIGSIYVRADMRHRGIGRALSDLAHEQWLALCPPPPMRPERNP